MSSMHKGRLQVTEMPLGFQGTEGYLWFGNYFLLCKCSGNFGKVEVFLPLLEKRKLYTNEAFIRNCEYLAGLLAVKFI